MILNHMLKTIKLCDVVATNTHTQSSVWLHEKDFYVSLQENTILTAASRADDVKVMVEKSGCKV
jgi:hypothetical protein